MKQYWKFGIIKHLEQTKFLDFGPKHIIHTAMNQQYFFDKTFNELIYIATWLARTLALLLPKNEKMKN